MNKNTLSQSPSTKAIAPKASFAIAELSFISGITLSVALLLHSSPALAHHPNGGKLPSNFVEGLLSGFGHPIIGIDHFVFVIAVGLLAALSKRAGMLIPVAFVAATAIGTAIHLQSVDLPVAELIISASVLVMGIFLARKEQTSLAILIVISAIAGIFHGYAYGESIVGAEITALGAYLLGFCAIQLAISWTAYFLGKKILSKASIPNDLPLRFAGFTICGIGFSFLSSAILG